MTHLVSAPRSPQLQRNEILDVSPPFEVQLWGVTVEAVEVKFRRQAEGPEEVALGMHTQALADVLEYANGTKGIRNILGRNRDRFERWTLQPSKIAGARCEPPGDERIYVYGPGLDTVAIISKQPKAVPFQDWLAERSYELRTKGFTGATPEITQAIEEQVLKSSPALRSQGSPLAIAKQLLDAAFEHEQRLSELSDGQRTLSQEQLEIRAALQAKTKKLEERLAKVEARNTSDQLQPGESSLTSLALRASWFSYASGGTLGYGDAVLLAMLNASFHERGLLRRRNTTVEVGETLRIVPQWVVTREGVEEFMGEVNPAFPVGEFKVAPNSTARNAGKHQRVHVIKGRP